jgi:hypothetical protein
MPHQIPVHRGAPLDEVFAAVRRGEGRAVAAPSVPVRDLAAEAGLTVLHARGRAGAAPFATAVELLAPAVEPLGAGARRRVFAGAASLAEPLFTRAARPATSEFAFVHGLYWLTARLADRGPLALLVESAGRGDEPSLRLCAYLAQRIDELPVALVLG